MIKLFDIDIETQTTLTMRHLDCKAEDLTVVCKGEGVKYQWCRESRGGTLLLRFTHTGKFRCEVYSGGKTASCEMSSRKLVYDAEKGGFPVLEGVEFEDGIFKTVKPELENSAGSGCSFLLKNDRSAKVSVVSEGELARVTKTEAHYVCPGLPCDEKSFAEYYWYDTGDMIFVNAYISAPEDEYLINFLKLRLKNAKTFSGSYPKIDGDIDGKRILGFDGSAVIVSDDMAIGLYGCRPLCGDFICADSITKSTCCYGVENVSAWLYYGNEERAKSLQSAALPTDAVWHILFTDGFSFSSNGVEFEVKKTQDGCVGALKNGSEWSGTPNNLFTVNAKDFVLTSDRGWKEVEFFSDGIEFSQNESVPSAKVVVRVKETDVGLDLRIECTGIPALWDVIFPSFRIYPTKGEADLFIPSASGRIEKNVISLPVHYREPYSAPFSNMSYLGCFDKDGIGCYFEWKGRGERRDYCVDSFSSKGILTVKSRLYPENMLNTDSYTSPFIGVCRTEKGWWGMASLYKSHVKNMPWYRTDHKRHDTWMENNNFWIWGWLRWDDENGRLGDEEACAEWREKCLEAAEILKGFDTVINVCEWSKIPPLVWKDDSTNPFLCNYACYGTNGMPNYFPARDGFRESCALLQSKGIKIQPYIDTRLWDIHTPNYETEGKALATKGADGVPYYEFYQQVDKEGKPQNLAVPCVYTQRWQDIIADTVGKLVNEYKVDGVYLDQTAAMAPMLCMDKSHGHPLGGGDWWVKGYAEMMRKMRLQSGDAVLTTECEAEPYMDNHDGFLTWTHVLPNQVPAYNYIYSDMIRMYGQCPVFAYKDYPNPDSVYEVRAMFAQGFTFGRQLGFMMLRSFINYGETLHAYVRTLLTVREGLLDFFNKGCLCMPPQAESEEEICYLWGRDLRPVVLPRVLSCVWELKGETVLILTNPNREDGTFSWKVDGSDYGFGDKFYIGDTLIDGQGEISVKVKSGAVRVFSVRSAS